VSPGKDTDKGSSKKERGWEKEREKKEGKQSVLRRLHTHKMKREKLDFQLEGLNDCINT
jgi:hypothetical protein